MSIPSVELTHTPEEEAAAAHRSAGSERLVSLDVFRGVTVAAMILVTDPGTYAARYAPLCHSDWVGPTSTDMIFPAFLVAIGMAMTFSFRARIERGASRAKLMLHALQRSAILIVLGLLLNGFPDYHLHTIRIPGILQHIALCYLAGSLVYLALFRRRSGQRIAAIAAVTVVVLALHWALLKLLPVPGFGVGQLDSLGNLGAWIDRRVFGVQHLWAYGTTPGYGVTFDPDGLLLTISSLGNLLIGVLAGEWLRTSHSSTRKIVGLVVAGAVLIVAGMALSQWMPLNKKLWTSTFTLLSSGVAVLIFTFFYLAVDVKRWRGWTTPALVFGTNAILAFALSSILTTLADRIHIGSGNSRHTLHAWGYLHGFASWMRPINASLAYAILIVLLNLVIVYPLYRKRIFLRV